MDDDVSPVLSPRFAATARSVLALLRTRLDLDSAMLGLKDAGQRVVLELLDGDGPWTPQAAWTDTVCGVMEAEGGLLLAADVLALPRGRELVARTGLPVRAYAGIALRDDRGEVVGSLCAYSSRPGADLRDHADLLRTLGRVVGDLLEHELAAVRAADGARHALAEARTDQLTGLLNRRGWQDEVTAAEQRSARTGRPAAVFVLDLDELKTVNDGVGHDAGDALLRRTARALQDAVELVPPALAPDVRLAAARVGGDEFALLVEGVDPPAADALALHLRHRLRDADVRASLGHAPRQEGRGLLLAWRQADELMLADKRERRGDVLVERRLPLPVPAPRTPVPAAVQVAEADAEIEALLGRVRLLLDLEVAFISRVSDAQTFTHVDSAIALPYGVGDTTPLQGSLCQLVLDGSLPALVADAREHPASRGLDIVRGGLVRAYLTVPVVLPDGSPYGTLCCFSRSPRHDLTPDVLSLLHYAAQEAGLAVGRLLRAREQGETAAARLEAVLDRGGLRIALQPVVDLSSGEVRGCEALSRFTDGRGPQTWLAEAHVCDQSARLQLAAFDAALATPLGACGPFLAVNLSPAVVVSPALQERLRVLPPERVATLVLELTEHEQVHDYGALAAALAPWRARGLRLAVDDTGAGHSSLVHVLRLHPDAVKLDRQLVTALDTDPVRRALVRGLQVFCDEIGVALVAEGVETAAEVEALLEAGVRWAQGFHLGRPELVGP